MRKLLVLLPVAATVAASVAACGTSAGTSASAANPPATASVSPASPASPTARAVRTIKVDEQAAATFTPKGGAPSTAGLQKVPSPGDQLVLRSTLVRGDAKVGTDEVVISFQAGGQALIDAKENLQGGQVVARGVTPFDQKLTVPVVSGTGAYAGATGTLFVDSQSNSLNHLTFTLR